jgi:hypothetical protein
MPFTSGYVTGTTSDPAHYKFLDVLRNFAVANGWEQLMYDGTSANRYVFLQGPGLTGNDPVWVGLNTYQSVSSGYYNVAVGVATGYLPSQTYYNQPQMKRIGTPLFYDRIDYWISLNAQRIVFVCKVGQSYYEHGYMGKFISYFSPIQYPYPVFVGGMFGYNYSSESYILQAQSYTYGSYHNVPYIGNQYFSGAVYGYNGQVYSSFDGKWESVNKQTLGYLGISLNNEKPVYNIDLTIRYDSNASYQRLTAGVYGTLDGVYRVNSDYDEIYPEDTIVVDGTTYIAFPSRNSTEASYLIRMDT